MKAGVHCRDYIRMRKDFNNMIFKLENHFLICDPTFLIIRIDRAES